MPRDQFEHLRYVTIYRLTDDGQHANIRAVPFTELPDPLVTRYLDALRHVRAVETEVAEAIGFSWDDEHGWIRP